MRQRAKCCSLIHCRSRANHLCALASPASSEMLAIRRASEWIRRFGPARDLGCVAKAGNLRITCGGAFQKRPWKQLTGTIPESVNRDYTGYLDSLLYEDLCEVWRSHGSDCGFACVAGDGGIRETQTYYKTIPELQKMGKSAQGQRLRVGGDV